MQPGRVRDVYCLKRGFAMSMQPEARVPLGRFGASVVRSVQANAATQRPRLVSDSFDKAVDIQLADTLHKRDGACSLINRRYAWRGYGNHHTVPTHRASATFTASDDTGVLGTVTLVVDSETGLAADRIFADELDPFRAGGRKICELSRLAFEEGLPSKPLLASLFHIVFIYGYHHHRCTDLFIEINPRHRRFYEAMLGFEAVGSVRTNLGVDAPAQLMRLEISTIRHRIDAANSDLSGDRARSLYALFFTAHDEMQLAEQLTSDAADHGWRQGSPSVKLFIPEG